MFEGVNFVSLTKPIYDIKIFDLFFPLKNQIIYAPNSCNVQKPWGGRCEQYCYVFADFCVYGEVSKMIQVFGKNLLEMEESLTIWEDLLELNGYIAWKCVGLPEETQWYFYKLYFRGVKGQGINLFEQEVLNYLKSKGKNYVEQYFSEIEQRFSEVYKNYNSIPE